MNEKIIAQVLKLILIFGQLSPTNKKIKLLNEI